MAYITNYNLKYEPNTDETEARFKAVYFAENETYSLRYAVDEDGETIDRVKWYDWPEHMLRISKMLPDLLFTLNGEGEESGDIWNAYFLDGKVQYARARVVIPDFDPTKLRASIKEARDLDEAATRLH